jgi:hypothetical protein
LDFGLQFYNFIIYYQIVTFIFSAKWNGVGRVQNRTFMERHL